MEEKKKELEDQVFEENKESVEEQIVESLDKPKEPIQHTSKPNAEMYKSKKSGLLIGGIYLLVLPSLVHRPLKDVQRSNLHFFLRAA